ncbi:uncharacterized protein LOC100575351 [Acyrthosiphon pisum]|uniref:Uncharacterized protein n=1 Tax=Acyrthosiphon pisum TaxID=7029 RepID=A0A8R1WB16_ACYPI|nr:uncharacterized protein LOC100575351 [Acyrthosiphon pisum]|eukprot:XP_003248007.1 PREDICTED: uncharacterized protein LOC100575351 [Acyrthosiphon pisum]
MAEPNTEYVDENNKANLENLKPTLQYTIFDEYDNEELLYPNEKLGILKRKLEIVRSRADNTFKKNTSPLRRPADNAPLHEVYKNVINKDSFTTLASILDNEKNVCSITSTENEKFKSTENNIKSVCNNNANIQGFNKPLNIEKTNQINSQAINENTKYLNVTNDDNIKKTNIASNKNTQLPKKKIKKRNKVVSIDKPK